jgi:hypothetical protein
MSLLDPRPRIDPAAAARIREWARRLWRLPVDAGVTVTELRCSEPGCPPLETVIVVAPRPGETFQRKVHKPAAEVTLADLDTLEEPTR